MRGKAYSTVIGGRVVWVDPETSPLNKVKAGRTNERLSLRSRLEDDGEVRARLACDDRRVGRSATSYARLSGKELDEMLAHYDLPPRQWVEE